MHGLAVNLIVSVSGHPWIINEIVPPKKHLTYNGFDLVNQC